MASGKAVISTAVGGVVDLLGECDVLNKDFEVCERGIGIKSNSVEGFVAGLRHLVVNDELRHSIETKGRAFALANFSKDRLVGDTKRLYLQLVGPN